MHVKESVKALARRSIHPLKESIEARGLLVVLVCMPMGLLECRAIDSPLLRELIAFTAPQ